MKMVFQKDLEGVKFYYQRISFLTELLDLQLGLRQEFLGIKIQKKGGILFNRRWCYGTNSLWVWIWQALQFTNIIFLEQNISQSTSINEVTAGSIQKDLKALGLKQKICSLMFMNFQKNLSNNWRVRKNQTILRCYWGR